MWQEFIDEYIFGHFDRPAAGYLSWQHLLMVIPGLLLMVFLAFRLAKKNKNEPFEKKINVLRTAALLMDGAELLKLVLIVIDAGRLDALLSNLPLFLCSIQLIALPIAAFSKGRLQKGMLDFVFIFGLLGALMGTLFAGNIYSYFPALHFSPMVSLFTHGIAGFSSLFIGLSGLATMEKKNIPLTMGTFLGFLVIAEIIDLTLQKNYMFLVTADGTPFEIVRAWVNASPVWYPILVSLLMFLYILAFYAIYFVLKKALTKKAFSVVHA